MKEFDQVYTEYFEAVYGCILKLSHDPDLAEEDAHRHRAS